jgi:hypothetical protein
MFLGGAFLAGLAIARFLKASGERRRGAGGDFGRSDRFQSGEGRQLPSTQVGRAYVETYPPTGSL